MKFFLPDWDDRVDPGYDFRTDRLSLQRDPYEDDLYAHELFGEPVYDGILLSRMALEGASKKRELAFRHGAKAYLRMPPGLELLGDCGAFGYVDADEPPFSVEDIATYYEELGFDLGVSVDHMVIPEFAHRREQRYQLTLRNAEAFLRLHREESLSFTPVGAVQGWTPETYAEAAASLIDMGYDYVAIGGLARSPTREVEEVMRAVAESVAGRARIHVFGVARASLVELFVELGVTSADSAAPLRQAWLAAKDNYYTMTGALAAIRIPAALTDRGRPGTLVAKSEAALATILSAERDALEAVRLYAGRRMGLEKTLGAIASYDRLLGERVGERDSHMRQRLYRETLKRRPWERCPCAVCRSIGIEVVIFRGNNRNRRRGFHNLWTLRRRLEAAMK